MYLREANPKFSLSRCVTDTVMNGEAADRLLANDSPIENFYIC
jgi:hypothetical protein